MTNDPSVPNHVLAFQFSGKMTQEDIVRYRNELEEKLKTRGPIGIYIDFTGLSDITATAMIEGTKADLELLSHLDRFGHCAFVSDKEWPRAVVQFLDPLLPALKMKVFAPEDRNEAMAWAAELADADRPAKPGIHFIPTSKDDVLAFEINGWISAEEMPDVIKKFEDFLKAHSKVRLFNRMTNFGGFDPAIFLQSGLLSMKLAAIQKVERYAIVGAPGWMRRIVENLNPVFAEMDIATFAADQEAEAWEWLGARPRS